MIIQEIVDEVFVKSYSDKRVKIHGGSPEGDYDEAIDPIDAGRTYVETNIPIDEDDDPTIKEKAEAYDILMGEITND